MARTLLLTITLSVFFCTAFSQKSSRGYLNSGKEALLEYKYDRAIEALSKAISMEGTLTEAYLSRALAYESIGQIDKAIIDYTAVIELGNRREAFYSRGVLNYRDGKLNDAYNDLKTALKSAGHETATVFYKSRPGETGVSSISTLATMDSEIYNYLGLISFERKKYDSAGYYFKQALELNQTEPDIWTNIGNLYKARGNIDRAVEAYDKALQLDQSNAVAMYNLALLAKEYKNEDAVTVFSKVIEANPGLPEAYEHRALAQFNNGIYDEALNDYNAAISLDTHDPDKYFNRALILEKLKQFENAYNDLTIALELGGDRAKVYFNRGNVLFKSNDFQGAEADYTLAITYNFTNPQAFYNRALARLNLGKDEDACNDLIEAVSRGMDKARSTYENVCREVK